MEPAEADVAAASPRHYMLRSWQHSELRLMVLHTVELVEVEYAAALPERVVSAAP